MPGRTKKSDNTASKGRSTALSSRTRKQIDSLPEHAQEIYKKAHANALKQYQKPEKRRGGKKQSVEQVAHKVAWAAVKRQYDKEGDMWVEKAVKQWSDREYIKTSLDSTNNILLPKMYLQEIS